MELDLYVLNKKYLQEKHKARNNLYSVDLSLVEMKNVPQAKSNGDAPGLWVYGHWLHGQGIHIREQRAAVEVGYIHSMSNLLPKASLHKVSQPFQTVLLAEDEVSKHSQHNPHL